MFPNANPSYLCSLFPRSQTFGWFSGWLLPSAQPELVVSVKTHRLSSSISTYLSLCCERNSIRWICINAYVSLSLSRFDPPSCSNHRLWCRWVLTLSGSRSDLSLISWSSVISGYAFKLINLLITSKEMGQNTDGGGGASPLVSEKHASVLSHHARMEVLPLLLWSHAPSFLKAFYVCRTSLWLPRGLRPQNCPPPLLLCLLFQTELYRLWGNNCRQTCGSFIASVYLIYSTDKYNLIAAHWKEFMLNNNLKI